MLALNSVIVVTNVMAFFQKLCLFCTIYSILFMRKIFKILALVVVVFALAATGIWYYVFVWSANHHSSAADEKGIVVTAAMLVETFEKSEQKGNTLYLDKTLEITGVVVYSKANQAGKQTIMLKSDDPMAGVLCTLTTQGAPVKEGESVTIKGICNGFLSDVVITNAVLVQGGNK